MELEEFGQKDLENLEKVADQAGLQNGGRKRRHKTRRTKSRRVKKSHKVKNSRKVRKTHRVRRRR